VKEALLILTVFHTNDIHGWIDNFGRAAAVVREHRGPKLLLDAGDWYQGTPEGTLSKGRIPVELFNALGYDALAPGNHEYDSGVSSLRELISRADMPVLSANTFENGRRPAWLKPWIVKDVEGVKVGLFGLTTSKTPRLNLPANVAGLEFRGEIESAKEAVAALRKAGATVIIAVTHVGFESKTSAPFVSEQRLAHEVEGIDLIVGGHTHVPIPPFRDAAHGTLLTSTGMGLKNLGEVALEIDRGTGKVLKSRGRLIELKEVEPDAEVQRLVEKRRASEYDVVIATATAPLRRRADGESAIGSWMTDCLRDWAKVGAAFQNGGGIRADIDEGPVTRRELFNVMPFDNKVVKLTLTPAQVRAVVDHGVGTEKSLQLSGLKVKYRKTAPAGKRVVSLEGDASSAAALDFMVRGGDGYRPLAEASAKTETGTYMRDVLIWCAEQQKVIRPPKPGRLEAVN
jgi:2',3'-cyclic-nucleotide 2'-phosphodiesterase (5'-nucleotidase family)